MKNLGYKVSNPKDKVTDTGEETEKTYYESDNVTLLSEAYDSVDTAKKCAKA